MGWGLLDHWDKMRGFRVINEDCDGTLSGSSEVRHALDDLYGIVPSERRFRVHEIAKTIDRIDKASFTSFNLRNVENRPYWKDYEDYKKTLEEGDYERLIADKLDCYPGGRFRVDEMAKIIDQIDVDSFIRRSTEIHPYWKDYDDYKKSLPEGDSERWIADKLDCYPGGFVGGPGDTRTAESMKQIPFEFSYHRYRIGPESDHDAGIQNPTDISKIICEDSVRNLLLDHAVLLGLAKKAILFRNPLNVNLPICERWTDVGSTTLRTLRKALKKVRSMQSRGSNIVSNGLRLFKNASKLAVGMVIIGNTPAVGAMAPEAVEPGSVQAEDFEKSSNFAFGVVACVGTLVAIFALLKSFKWSRRHSIAGTSAASALTGAILNRTVNMPQTLTVLRSWRETELREVVVARREEEGAYAS